MVANERDAVILIQKAEVQKMPEAKRKKKLKKKQVDTPRPACSWVYFSREFIKEYSASHPESSGLKAATKAASEAWKSMSLEEKAKYTRRAREVWDSYLRSTPARTPKPRKQTKLVTRCSPGRLYNVLLRLTPEQKDAVRSMGFGSLLGLRCRTLRRSLCLWLLDRFNTSRRSLEICGECIPLSPKDVELVMGLAARGKDVVNSGPDDLIADLRHSYNATNHGISVRLLEERLAAPEAGEDFKRSFVLYALGTVLCPTARLDVSPSFLHFLTNMDVVHQYNWGKFLLDRLVREVSRYRQGKQCAVGGCLLFLQIFYYKSISIEGSGVVAPSVLPCLSLWGEEEITEREKREKELGGYGSGEVTCKKRSLAVESSEYRCHLGSLPVGEMLSEPVHGPLLDQETNQEDMPVLENHGVICCDIEVVVESLRSPCPNKEYGCNETVDYTNNIDHGKLCLYSPCACPIRTCNFVGSSKQLSLHFSSKHWDSGRRFRYNNPITLSLAMNEEYLVLQAEDDGVLFCLNKGGESIGKTVMITCIAPSSSTGRLEGSPSMDFLLIPFRFLGSSGELHLEICIWNSTEFRVDCH